MRSIQTLPLSDIWDLKGVKPINADLIQEDIYLCLGCLPNFLNGNKVPFLCVPKSSETFQTKINGLMMQYPAELEIPFYGYKCCECQSSNQKMYFKCTECQERKDVWCENCFKGGLSGCIKQQHAVVLESNPFSFWCEKMSENEFDHLKLQRKIAVNDDVFQQAEMFFRCHQYQKSINPFSYQSTIFVMGEKERFFLQLSFGKELFSTLLGNYWLQNKAFPGPNTMSRKSSGPLSKNFS